MGIHRDNLDISAEIWLELLKDSSVFKDNDIALMKALYNCKGCRETASKLALILGVSRYSVLNLQIGRLGKRIINKLPNVKFPTNKNGTIRYWLIPFWSEDAEKKGQYYWELRPELKRAIEKFLNEDKIGTPRLIVPINNEPEVQIAQEITDNEISNLYEGVKKQITVNAYERNPKARQLCLQKYGFKCCVCGFDFEEVYGEIGIGYIEVHHLTPLNEINKEYQVNPVNDLRPVCPNCHSMLHKANLSIEQLRDTLRKESNF
jgi:5-methylcytosine-specific restriction protein A